MNEKTWPFAGISWNSQFGDLFKTRDKNPMQVQGEIGFKYGWHLITYDFNFNTKIFQSIRFGSFQ